MTFADLVTNFRHQLEMTEQKERSKGPYFSRLQAQAQRLADELGDVSLLPLAMKNIGYPESEVGKIIKEIREPP